MPHLAQLFPDCPSEWSGAERIPLNGSSADVTLDGRVFRVGGNAGLDYMPKALAPGEALGGRVPHPLVVVASISAPSRDALGAPVFTCFRVTRGAETWARRPATYDTQTLADGYPPGAPTPTYNEAWRQASRDDGPEWQVGDIVTLELWAEVHRKRYVFVTAPISLRAGG